MNLYMCENMWLCMCGRYGKIWLECLKCVYPGWDLLAEILDLYPLPLPGIKYIAEPDCYVCLQGTANTHEESKW